MSFYNVSELQVPHLKTYAEIKHAM